MQQLEPLAIVKVGLAAGHIVKVTGVDEKHFESSGFEQLVQRNPVDVGALHGHRHHPFLDQPIGEIVEL